ncbi:hypothetical protein AcV7_009899 [Taiwanofungus camphoratus]|nr:hypothetical protein AcW2_007243 [Antrodia cinnamomea]KAI0947477.1 hypothetical protein AcV7_009899 [Antrodia cinnamomea]
MDHLSFSRKQRLNARHHIRAIGLYRSRIGISLEDIPLESSHSRNVPAHSLSLSRPMTPLQIPSARPARIMVRMEVTRQDEASVTVTRIHKNHQKPNSPPQIECLVNSYELPAETSPSSTEHRTGSYIRKSQPDSMINSIHPSKPTADQCNLVLAGCNPFLQGSSPESGSLLLSEILVGSSGFIYSCSYIVHRIGGCP